MTKDAKGFCIEIKHEPGLVNLTMRDENGSLTAHLTRLDIDVLVSKLLAAKGNMP